AGEAVLLPAVARRDRQLVVLEVGASRRGLTQTAAGTGVRTAPGRAKAVATGSRLAGAGDRAARSPTWTVRRRYLASGTRRPPARTKSTGTGVGRTRLVQERRSRRGAQAAVLVARAQLLLADPRLAIEQISRVAAAVTKGRGRPIALRSWAVGVCAAAALI